MAKVVDTLKNISLDLTHIKLDKKQLEKFPELLKVLQCHAQSTEYIIQFFKDSLVSNSCKGCMNVLFKPVRMSRSIYDNAMAFPMPMLIPKHVDASESSTDLQYLSFKDAHMLPFTNEHQSSLASTTLRVAARQRKTTKNRQLPLSRVVSGPIITKLKNKSNFKIGVAFKFAAWWNAEIVTSLGAFTLTHPFLG